MASVLRPYFCQIHHPLITDFSGCFQLAAAVGSFFVKIAVPLESRLGILSPPRAHIENE
jgi:hypothetical protein